MSNVPNQFAATRRLAAITVVVASCAAVLTGAYGVYVWVATGQALPGVALILAAVFVQIFALLLYAQIVLIHKFVANSFRMYDGMLEVADLLRRQGEYARRVAENSALSDWAKRTIYREKDYEFLRDSIQSAIVRQDWETAEHMIRDLDEQFGFHDEAASLSERLLAARRSTKEERLEAALRRFETLCSQAKWEQARGECARLRELFPSDARIGGLPREIDLRRDEHKRRLLQQYDEAVRNEMVDQAHALLIELDHYLTRDEAAALKESARSIFRAHLEQLRAQFTLAVQNKQFSDAIEVGERVCREFPNSGYAREIAGMLPRLRERATGAESQEAVAVSTM